MLNWFKKNKRKEYRAEPQTDPLFSFSLILSDQNKLAGDMADVNMSGVAISFPVEECPELEMDEQIRLALLIHRSGKNIMLDALVKDSSRSQDAILYRFQFINPTYILQNMDPALLHLFNRREAFRVKADAMSPIEVDLEWEKHLAKGLMLDISETGIAIGIESSISWQFEFADQITMTFILPECEAPIRIVGKTTHFVPFAKMVRYGIEFDLKITENIKQQERAISRYVMKRQTVMLKSK